MRNRQVITRSTARALILGGVLISLIIVWRVLGALDLVTAERLYELVNSVGSVRKSVWLTPIVMLLYAVLLLAMFPLTVIVVATGLIFGPYWGLYYATVGTLSSSALSFWVGHWVGRATLTRFAGERLNGIGRYFSERGLRTMVLINLLPIAPFTLTNLLAGAFNLNFRRYMIGSVIGITPGLAAVTILGSQMGALLFSSQPGEWVAPIVVAITCVMVLILLPRVARHYWK